MLIVYFVFKLSIKNRLHITLAHVENHTNNVCPYQNEVFTQLLACHKKFLAFKKAILTCVAFFISCFNLINH